MLDAFGKTQQTLLQALHANKAGLTIDLISELLQITRTAIRQHVTALESQGFIKKGQSISSGGRPSQFYVLSAKGLELFPKHYSLFAELVLEEMLREKGAADLQLWLTKLGQKVALSFKSQVADSSLNNRLIKTVNIMNTLAYDAQLVMVEGDMHPAIEATNCVYHHLAASFPQVCQFDVALITDLTETQIIHEKCIQKGDNQCRFCIKT